MYPKIFKRLLDLLISLVLFIILLPVFIVICICLLIANRGKVFFFQERPGYKEQAFSVIKFKTMNDRKDANGNLLPNHVRTTALGAFLRNSSLDEIPQLINVIAGEMSLVGPRPLLFKYIPLFKEHQRARHNVRPGITGWAQVNGRNTISWTKKFEYDIYYVNHISLMLDLKIFWLTVLKVIRRDGINAGATVTAEPFNGNN